MWNPLKRFAVRIALAGVLLVIGLGVFFYLNLNRLVKTTVEQQTTQVLNLPTTVDSASLAVFGGKLRLTDGRIASPPGFSGEPLLAVHETEMVTSYGGLRGDPVRLTSVRFKRPRLLIEQVNGKLNIKQMVDGLPPPPADPMKLVVDEVTVEDATVVLRRVPGIDKPEVVVRVPTFTLRNVGRGEGAEGGATVKDVVLQLVSALAVHASDSKELPLQFRLFLKGDVTVISAHLGAEAQRQIEKVFPGQMGKALSGFFEPGATRSPTRFFGGFLGGGPSTRPSGAAPQEPPGQPATRPASPRPVLPNPFKRPGGIRPTPTAPTAPATQGSE